MSVKGDAIEVGVAVVVVGAALWYVSRKIGSGLSSVGAALSSAGTAVADGASSAWTTATTPVLPTDSGVPAVDGAAALGNGVVSAPAGLVDSLSMGLIGGSGGTGGNGGIGGWLWHIVSGEAFAPAAADQGAPIDLGNGAGW